MMRLLVIGVGSIGERHVRCFLATGRATVSICEIQPQLRATVCERYAVHASYSHLDEALRDPHDAAVICTPAHLHVPMAMQLARAGVQLLIEKPLSTNLDGVAELADLVASRGVACAVAYVLRSHPALAGLKQALDSGRFGRPVQLVFNSGQHFPTYRPAYREIYYADRATGGGAIQDALTHGINAAQWLVGPADRVAADAAHQVLDGVSVEDTVHVLARHGNVLGSYQLNQYQAPNEGSLTVVCERGTVRFESHEARWRWMVEPGSTWHDEPISGLERDDLFIAQANHFLDVLQHGAAPLCTLAEATDTLQAITAILAASSSASWIEIPGAAARSGGS